MTAAPHTPEIELDPHASAADVRAFFERDRFLAAYALADLDPENVDQSRWWVARRGEEIVAASLLVEVLPFRPCFAMGESQALAELFRSGMTAVGNVLTRLAYRNRGMATSVTSAVTEAALEDHKDVVLNVRQDNLPAISVYRRLGYDVHAPFIEGPAVRRAVWERLTKNLFGRTP